MRHSIKFASVVVVLALAVATTGCMSYSPAADSYSPNLILPTTQFSTPKQRNLSSLHKAPLAPFAIYDFDSVTSKHLRALAHSPQREVELAQEVSLAILLCIAYEKNPRLQASLRQRDAAMERYSQVSFLHDLVQQYTAFTRSLDISAGTPHHKASIRDKIVFPGSVAIAGKIVDIEVQIAHYQYLIALKNLVYEVSVAYYQWIYAKATQKLHDEHHKIIHALEQTARDKFRAGQASYADVLRAQIRKAKTDVEKQTTAQEVKAAEGQLLALLNLPPSTALGTPLDTTPQRLQIPLTEIRQRILEHRQEIQLAGLQTKKIQQLIAFMKENLYPDLAPGLGYFEDKTAERAGSTRQAPTFDDRLPSPMQFSFGQRDSYLKEMHMHEKTAHEHRYDLEQKAIAQLHQLYFQLDESWSQYILHQEQLIPFTKETLQVIRVSYQAGSDTDFRDVLDTENTWLQLSLTRAKNKLDYLIAVVGLTRLVGCRLP